MTPRLILYTVMLLAASIPLTSRIEAQDVKAEIDRLFSWATPSTPGCAVGVSRRGETVVNRAYGAADLERDVPLRPDTVFDAGSLTKQFVAASVLLLVDDGRLSLSDDVRKYVPELPDYGHPITIDHLLTHTSGLRDWTALAPLAPGDPDALSLILRQRALNFAPGEEWAYSNSGYVLLKEIVTRVSGSSFADFAHKRLFLPLGMKTTSYRLDLREIVKNRALAYDRQGERWRMAMLLDNDRGGGGALLTTTGDLLIWNDALTAGRLGGSVSAKLQEPAALSNGRRLGYGRGLILDENRGGKVLWHTGSADGYKSLLSRYPEQGLSIAILCNSGDDTDQVGFARAIFDLFVPGERASAQQSRGEASTRGGAPVDPELPGRAGLFFNERTGRAIRLVFDRGTLRVAAGPPLTAAGPARYKPAGRSLQFMSEDDFVLRFTSADAFELESMEGAVATYRRARPWSPVAADLAAFAGRYENGEIGSVFQVSAAGGGLEIRLEHAPEKALEFKPIEPDTFQRGMMFVRFVRDRSGKIVALDLTNPLLRNVRFARPPSR